MEMEIQMEETKRKAMEIALSQAKATFKITGQMRLEYVMLTDQDEGWMFNVAVREVVDNQVIRQSMIMVMDMAFEYAREIFELHGEMQIEFLMYEATDEHEAFWEFEVRSFGGECGDDMGCSFDLKSL